MEFSYQDPKLVASNDTQAKFVVSKPNQSDNLKSTIPNVQFVVSSYEDKINELQEYESIKKKQKKIIFQ